MKYWSEDGSQEPKHVANCVLLNIYVLCLSKLFYHVTTCTAIRAAGMWTDGGYIKRGETNTF